MCPDSLSSALTHHLLHAAAVSGAVVAVAILALGLEMFRHLMERLGASGELLYPLRAFAVVLAWTDLVIIGALAAKSAQALCLW